MGSAVARQMWTRVSNFQRDKKLEQYIDLHLEQTVKKRDLLKAQIESKKKSTLNELAKTL